MTEQVKAEKIAKKVADNNKAIKERKANEIKSGFLNPFGEKTSYIEFLEQVEKSKKTVEDYCKGKLTTEQLEFLQKELSIIKK